MTTELRTRLEHLRVRDLFFEKCPVMFYSVSPTEIILDCNAAVLDRLGYALSELVGQSLAKLYTETSQALVGLAISKAIVDLHGGEIGVDSEPGVGATFFFELAPKRPGVG